MELTAALNIERTRIEAALEAALPAISDENTARRGNHAFDLALRHAITAGGKRVRPTLTLLCAKALGANEAMEADALRGALAIEFLHNYTLVHDDLPAMDNDTERRGAPSVWAQFGEGTAILAGDWLQAHAFGQLVNCKRASDMLKALYLAATQVIRGQISDIAAAQDSPSTWNSDLLGYVFLNKTAMLISTACRLGAIAAEADAETEAALADYGTNVGLAFQYIDDLLDAQQAKEGNELSAVRVWDGDLDTVRRIAAYCTDKALKALHKVKGDTALLEAFAESLLQRLN